MPTTYRIPAAEALSVEEALTRRFGAPERPDGPLEQTFYDTFDWRLYRKRGCVVSRGRTVHQVEWTDREGGPLHAWRSRKVPGFARDVPSGPAREALAGVIKARRLLPVVRTEALEARWPVSDEGGHTVASLVLSGGRARAPFARSDAPLPWTLRVESRRKAGRAGREVRRIAEKTLGLAPVDESPLESALSAIGRRPGAYASSPRVLLEPDMRTDQALVEILSGLLDVVRENEPGLRRDLDPEFLHDFRVASRRTRAALSQIKGVFPPETEVRFRRDFRELGRATGPLRDLDVHLLRLEAYQRQLAPDVRQDVTPLRRFAEHRRKSEHARVVDLLDGVWYRTTMRDWARFLAVPPPEAGSGPRGLRPVVRTASSRIRKAHRRVVRGGTALGRASPASDFHALRLDCKKLRYLLEFFRTLYGDAAGEAIAALKSLQDSLGAFNDLEVQQHALRRFALEMSEAGSVPPEALLTAGQLLERLRVRQQDEREEALRRFARFARPVNRRRFEKLVPPPRE